MKPCLPSMVAFLEFSVEKQGDLNTDLDGDGMNRLWIWMKMSDMTYEMMMEMDGIRGETFMTNIICSDQNLFENFFEKTKFIT